MVLQIRPKPETGFVWGPKQVGLRRLMANPRLRHIMAYGGSRSGKSFCFLHAIATRALFAPGSRHAVLRFRAVAAKQHALQVTFRDVMRKCYPQVEWKENRQDGVAILPTGSEVWFGGLDEKERTEKLLGAEYATIFLNECSQISWTARGIALTRLSQEIGLRQVMLYDCNPPTQSHWSYKVFILGVDPVSGEPLPRADSYKAVLINPRDNAENLGEEYLLDLEKQADRQRRRFFLGQFLPESDDALWQHENFDAHRRAGGELPDFQRIVIGVDPSGASSEAERNNDDIGIVVAALGADGEAYVLEDLTLKAGPMKWGSVVGRAYERHAADVVVAEKNYGGAMVEFTIQAARPNTPVRLVTATRGKVIRAEPIASLYEQGKVHHCGTFPRLEDELCEFSPAGYLGARSPNRADALIWALTELFPGMVRRRRGPIVIQGMRDYDPLAF